MEQKIAVVGLGYVGLPVAVAFGRQTNVIGFDINQDRINELKKNYDRTKEVMEEELKIADINFTSNPNDLKYANFIIIAVPTPIDEFNAPDLTLIRKVSETVGANMSRNTIVVYESTVYPGVTEEICIPILEKSSNLSIGKDFSVGYSPERINPGDKVHTFSNIMKVVSGYDEKTLNIVADTYSLVVEAGVYKASSIKVAEAAKVIENTQRDVNIALMNELSLIFDKLNIDTTEVLNAASTKWNFLNFKPGLVGGHCIGVDPYYLTHKAQQVGHHPEIILAGRRINDNMSNYIVSSFVKQLVKNGHTLNRVKVNVLGLTFKENCPDLRNTKVIDIINELQDYGFIVNVNDVEADKEEAKRYYGIDLKPRTDLKMADAVIFAVPHKDYIINKEKYLELLNKDGIVIDIKGIIEKTDIKLEQSLWRL
ncbi:nucleotide sugar dehydrogenase [Macrococcus equi]|uniref:nucleotide sugar dehydrogenase n=1 Tax=Macrococcus equi TaxID=3395462 RepID=UPI0039BE7480